MSDFRDDKLRAVERVAEALARGDEKRRIHWLAVIDRLGESEYGAALVARFSAAIVAGDEDMQAEAALDIAKFMQRQNSEFHNRGGAI